MAQKKVPLSPELIEQILIKLGFSKPPAIDLPGLSGLYKTWCSKVPFDNIRKRIHLAANSAHPLPGHDDTEFFQGWLDYGVGGTCWAGNAALHALLDSLGFSCCLATATMEIGSNQQPDHGTVAVQFDTNQFLVDASMLHNQPLQLIPGKTSSINHPAWGLKCSPHEEKWLIHWRPLHMLDGCDCRIGNFSISRDSFRQLNEESRKRSPFNDSLYIRLNSEEIVMGISDGTAFNFLASGEIIKTTLTHEKRLKLLIEQFGISEEIAFRVPPDRNT